MSTVLITPTHIASDHTYLHNCYPPESKVDIQYKKLFMPSTKAFVIGTCGNFIPSDIDTPEVYQAILEIISELVIQKTITELKTDLTSVWFKEEAIKIFKKVFDYTAPTFLVTRNNRWVIKFLNRDDDKPSIRRCGPYAGLGSGGSFGVGLLLGGIKLPNVWEPLNMIDPQTSLEHTIIPLSVLKPWTVKAKGS